MIKRFQIRFVSTNKMKHLNSFTHFSAFTASLFVAESVSRPCANDAVAVAFWGSRNTCHQVGKQKWGQMRREYPYGSHCFVNPIKKIKKPNLLKPLSILLFTRPCLWRYLRCMSSASYRTVTMTHFKQSILHACMVLGKVLPSRSGSL